MAEERRTYPFPAAASFFIPALGQLLKGQWRRALLILLSMALPWVVAGIILALTSKSDAGILVAIFGWVLASVVDSGIWIWQIFDAYRYPAD